MTLCIQASSFSASGEIPARHTCEGEGVSPALTWSGAPAGTQSFALIVHDPDAPDPAAPARDWVHWVVYNVPAAASALLEAVPATELPAGARFGRNDWGRAAYGGPCPPIGRHRYFHRLYALDVVLPELGAASRAELERAMEGHVLASAELVGTYEKRGGGQRAS
jgi:Raf kinase inhibitor-like YbhB/YbcL family protein